jgi:hypothetical protein
MSMGTLSPARQGNHFQQLLREALPLFGHADQVLCGGVQSEISLKGDNEGTIAMDCSADVNEAMT